MKLPILSGKEVVKILSKLGFTILDQKGSHIHLRHPEKNPVTIPNHKVISKKTLSSIIKATDLKESDFE